MSTGVVIRPFWVLCLMVVLLIARGTVSGSTSFASTTASTESTQTPTITNVADDTSSPTSSESSSSSSTSSASTSTETDSTTSSQPSTSQTTTTTTSATTTASTESTQTPTITNVADDTSSPTSSESYSSSSTSSASTSTETDSTTSSQPSTSQTTTTTTSATTTASTESTQTPTITNVADDTSSPTSSESSSSSSTSSASTSTETDSTTSSQPSTSQTTTTTTSATTTASTESTQTPTITNVAEDTSSTASTMVNAVCTCTPDTTSVSPSQPPTSSSTLTSTLATTTRSITLTTAASVPSIGECLKCSGNVTSCSTVEEYESCSFVEGAPRCYVRVSVNESSEDGELVVTMGCMNVQTCNGDPSLVTDVSRCLETQSGNCLYCCSSDNCNFLGGNTDSAVTTLAASSPTTSTGTSLSFSDVATSTATTASSATLSPDSTSLSTLAFTATDGSTSLSTSSAESTPATSTSTVDIPLTVTATTVCTCVPSPNTPPIGLPEISSASTSPSTTTSTPTSTQTTTVTTSPDLPTSFSTASSSASPIVFSATSTDSPVSTSSSTPSATTTTSSTTSPSTSTSASTSTLPTTTTTGTTSSTTSSSTSASTSTLPTTTTTGTTSSTTSPSTSASTSALPTTTTTGTTSSTTSPSTSASTSALPTTTTTGTTSSTTSPSTSASTSTLPKTTESATFTTTTSSTSASTTSTAPLPTTTSTLPPTTTLTPTTAIPTSIEPTTTSNPPPSTTTTLATTSSTSKTASTTPRTTALTCLFCNNEPPEFCNTIQYPSLCTSVDEVCYLTYTNGISGTLSKGCKPRTQCQDLANANDERCYGEVVSGNCTKCCEDSDRCNVDSIIGTTTAATTVTSPAIPVCDMVDYQRCLVEFQGLVLMAAADPDILFNQFCGAVPAVFSCLASSMSGCVCADSDASRLNTTLEAVIANLTSMCPASCDPPTGFNCSLTYFKRVVAGFADNADCMAINSVETEMDRCRARSTGSCDFSVRQKLNATYSMISQQWRAACTDKVPPTPPPVTESPYCNRTIALQCIIDLGVDVTYFLYDGGDISTVCARLEEKEDCYLSAVSTCSNGTRQPLEVAWNFTKSLIASQCISNAEPKCDTIAARSCILVLWNLVHVAKDLQQACSLIPSTLECITFQTAGCSYSDQFNTNNSMNLVLGDIGNRCDNTIELTPGNGTYLDVYEGGNTTTIYYQFNQPPSGMCSAGQNCRIFVEIDIEVGTNSKYPRCLKTGKVIAQAVLMHSDTIPAGVAPPDTLSSREVTSSNWNSRQSVNVAAKMDFKYDGLQQRQMTVTLRKVDATSGITIERRTVATYRLNIHDGDRSAVCSCVNDPHITTFDGWYFNNFQENFFMLYRHSSNLYDVQIISQRCNGAAACNCGVGVRSGDTVLYVDRCRKKSLLDKLGCHSNKYQCKNLMKTTLYAHGRITPGTRMFSYNSGSTYVVWMPHGTVVKVSVDGDFLNVWITASPADWQRTEGLCGVYNGVWQDDMKLRDGNRYVGVGSGRGQQPVDYTKNWIVTVSENTYVGVSNNSYSPPYYCESRASADGSNITNICGYDLILETCDWDTRGAVEIVYSSSLKSSPSNGGGGRPNGRQKRDTTDLFGDLDVDPSFNPPPISENGTYTYASAEALCTSFFANISVARMCVDNGVVSDNSSMENCIDDLMATGQRDWMDSALTSLQERCSQELSRNTSFDQNIVGSINAVNCPGQCNGHGNCTNGTCICEPGYNGTDCSINLNAAITLAFAYNGICDTTTSDCSVVQMIGLTFVQDVTTCTVQNVMVNESGVTPTGQPYGVAAEVQSASEIHCVMPSAGSALVTLRNGNSEPTDTTLFLAYNPNCYVCIYNVSSGTCQVQNETCVIGGSCYTLGQQNPSDRCQICDPSRATDSFSSSTASECQQSEIGLIVGLSVGLGIAAIAAIAATVIGIVCYRMKHTASGPLSGDEPPKYTEVYDATPPYEVAIPASKGSSYNLQTSRQSAYVVP